MHSSQAYRGSIHTVLTSGSIMVLVTAVVGKFFGNPTIEQICRTISIGAFSAIILILLFLPGMLALLDRWVLPRDLRRRLYPPKAQRGGAQSANRRSTKFNADRKTAFNVNKKQPKHVCASLFFSTCQKPRRVCCPQAAKRVESFLRRHVRRRKYRSGCKWEFVRRWHKLCAQQTANLLSKSNTF